MSITIAEQVPLAPYTTFRIGGAAEFFVSVSSADELREAVAWAKERHLPVTALAGGSNVLVADEGVRGLVVRIDIGGIEYGEEGGAVIVRAGAGVVFDELVADTVARGYWGLENLSAIPGSVGATPVQNVGAYGVEVSSLIERVRALDTETFEERTFAVSECAFGYRDSVFKRPEGKRYIVTEVVFRLSKTPRPQLGYKDLQKMFGERAAAPPLADIRAAVTSIRRGKFPDWAVVGTAGSFFKNPVVPQAKYEELQSRFPELAGFPTSDGGVKLHLGWILDRVLGLRGFCDGDVCAYEQQALVIVNRGTATARDVDAFARALEKKVFDATGLSIEREVRTLE